MNFSDSLKKEPIEVQEEWLKDYHRRRYCNSLFDTAKELCGYKDITKFTHGPMIAALEEASPRKLIVMPRGTFKSSISSVAYPIWLLMRDPNERILLDSELYSNSKNLLREIKMHLTSDTFKYYFGDWMGEPWNEGEAAVKVRTKIFKEASITASGIGAEKTGQHYRIAIADDLNSPNNSHTEEGREKVVQHYRYLTSILEPDGILAVVATRYHMLDIPGFCLRNEIEMEKI